MGAEAAEGLVVIGEGRATIAPDIIVLTISVDSRSASASQALHETTKKVLSVLSGLSQLNVNQSDVENPYVVVYPLYTHATSLNSSTQGTHPHPAGQHLYPQGSQFEMVGASIFSQPVQPGTPPAAAPSLEYHASSYLRVTVRDPNQVGPLLDAVSRAGATYCSGATQKYRDEDAARRKALEAASKNARAKAELLAATAGRKLGALVALEEEALPETAPSVGPASGWANGLGLLFPGEVEVKARVRARYELQ